ncbi:MAG: ABC transporter permease [Oscillospiraceae bacterium]|nr:ABC transporter permease [Oscillospiraceae bacterium]
MKNSRSVRLRLAVYALLTLGLVFLMLFGERLAPYDPYKNDLYAIDMAPCREHLMGTDNLGRDIFSRVLTGARNSLGATFAVVAATGVIGTAIGVLAGYYGQTLDRIVQRVLLVFQSFPGQILAIAVAGVLGAGTKNAALALILVGWMANARMARSLTMKLRSSVFINAARLCGCTSGYIIFHHILPNISKMMVVSVMLSLASTMMEISSLAFLGLASKPPFPEWGFMINEGRKVLMTAPWQALMPGLAIFVSVVILNRLGDSVQDYMELTKESV